MVHRGDGYFALQQIQTTLLNKLDESLLTDLQPFLRLERSQIREILDHASPKRFEANSSVFEAGFPADRFYLLLDGMIRVVRSGPDGEHIIVLHIPSGQLFGIAPMLGRDTYPATAVAASECLVLSWPVRLWHDFVARYDGFGSEAHKVMGARMDEVQNTIMAMATQQVEQRVASALMRLINQSGKETEDGILIDFPITRRDISEMTGTTLHTVSRLLSAWEKQGIVQSARRKIVVSDAHRLLLISETRG